MLRGSQERLETGRSFRAARGLLARRPACRVSVSTSFPVTHNCQAGEFRFISCSPPRGLLPRQRVGDIPAGSHEMSINAQKATIRGLRRSTVVSPTYNVGTVRVCCVLAFASQRRSSTCAEIKMLSQERNHVEHRRAASRLADARDVSSQPGARLQARTIPAEHGSGETPTGGCGVGPKPAGTLPASCSQITRLLVTLA